MFVCVPGKTLISQSNSDTTSRKGRVLCKFGTYLVNITTVILLETSFNAGIPNAWHTYIKTLLEALCSCFLIIFCLPDYSFIILSPLLVRSLPLISYCPYIQVHLLSYYHFYQFCHSSHTSAVQFSHLTDFAGVYCSSLSIGLMV